MLDLIETSSIKNYSSWVCVPTESSGSSSYTRPFLRHCRKKDLELCNKYKIMISGCWRFVSGDHLMNPACGTALVNHLMMLCRAILPLQPRLSSLNPLDADVTEVHSHPKGLAQVFFSNCVVKVRRGHDLDKMVTLSRIGPVKLCNIQSSGRIASDESLLPAFLFLSWMSSLEQFAPEQLHNKSQ